MKRYSIFIALIACLCQVFAQKQANNWMFGSRKGITFNTDPPTFISGAQIMPIDTNVTHFESTASISDCEGNLLFYASGERVWNSNHEIMPNGNGLLGHYSATNAAFAVPIPLSNSKFYLFTSDAAAPNLNLHNGIRYSIIDMDLDSGKGDITLGSKNILLLDSACEKIAAVSHPNGKDIWLIVHKYGNSAFYAYLISENGIALPVITNIGTNNGPYPSAVQGQIKASSNGSRIACAITDETDPRLELFDFDNSTGALSNFVSLNLSPGSTPYSVEFSSDNSKLYVDEWAVAGSIYQYNLQAGNDAIAINNTKNLIASYNQNVTSMQLAPDSKIYISLQNVPLFETKYLSCIEKPDSLGIGCLYKDSAVYVGEATLAACLPNFISGLEYHNTLPGCALPMQLSVEEGGVCGPACDGIAKVNITGGTSPYNYIWSNGDTMAITSNLCAGTYYVTVTDVNSVTMLGTANVAIQNVPIISLPAIDTICSGDTVQLCANSSTVTYNWNNGETTNCINVRLAGNYYVTVSDGSSCTATASTAVYVYPLSPVSTTGSADTLRVIEGITVQWYLNNEPIDGATEHEYIAKESGNYTVAITDERGCTVRSNVIQVLVTSINRTAASVGLMAYPNPSNGQWLLNVTDEWFGSQYKLYSLNGQLLDAGIIKDKQINITIADAQGAYVLQVLNEKQSLNIKLVAYK